MKSAESIEAVHFPVDVRTIEIAPKRGVSLGLAELWEYRELLWCLVWRDVSVKYKQTLLGAGWAIVQPLTAAVIFSVVFGRLAQLPSGGVPYPLFSFTALIVWQFLSTGVARAAVSLVTSGNLVTKVYFPRLLVPTAAALAGGVDFIVSFAFLLGMLAFYRVPVTASVLALPLIVGLAFTATLGVGVWLAALNARYRDVGQITPFLLQVWLYASPVAYSSRLIPERWQFWYALNPAVGVIDGFRWALLGTPVDLRALGASTITASLVLVTGVVYFRWKERTVADVI